jgi:2,3-bisphosphoglycerate-independent phosphoglycerate mutase
MTNKKNIMTNKKNTIIDKKNTIMNKKNHELIKIMKENLKSLDVKILLSRSFNHRARKIFHMLIIKKKMTSSKKRIIDTNQDSNSESFKKSKIVKNSFLFSKTSRKIKDSRVSTKILSLYTTKHYELYDIANSITSKLLTSVFISFAKYDHYFFYVNSDL